MNLKEILMVAQKVGLLSIIDVNTPDELAERKIVAFAKAYADKMMVSELAKETVTLLAVTDDEQALLELTAQIWNGFARLGDKHPSDLEELHRDLHNIQNRIMARVASRANPELFTATHDGETTWKLKQ